MQNSKTPNQHTPNSIEKSQRPSAVDRKLNGQLPIFQFLRSLGSGYLPNAVIAANGDGKAVPVYVHKGGPRAGTVDFSVAMGKQVSFGLKVFAGELMDNGMLMAERDGRLYVIKPDRKK